MLNRYLMHMATMTLLKINNKIRKSNKKKKKKTKELILK